MFFVDINFSIKSPNSYHPIYILSCLDKVFEKGVLNKLNEYTENNNTQQRVEFGFGIIRLIHPVNRIVNLISKNKGERKSI